MINLFRPQAVRLLPCSLIYTPRVDEFKITKYFCRIKIKIKLCFLDVVVKVAGVCC